jgi:hypothetical protein
VHPARTLQVAGIDLLALQLAARGGGQCIEALLDFRQRLRVSGSSTACSRITFWSARPMP